MAGIAANLSVFGILFFTPEKISRLFPIGTESSKTPEPDSKTTFLPIDEDKMDDGDYFSRNSSSAPLKSASSSNCSSTEYLAISEYVYLWLDKRFLLLAARLILENSRT